MKTSRLTLGVLVLGSAVGLQAAREVMDYRYDGAGRLVAAVGSEDGSGSGQSYAFDAAGNLTTNIVYGAGNRDADYDADALRDLDELFWFGDYGQSAAGDPDGDGLANSNELALAGSPLLTDTDGDGADDMHEYVAGTALTNAADSLRIVDARWQTGGLFQIQWPMKAGRTYQVLRTPRLGGTWAGWGAPFASTNAGLGQAAVPAGSNEFLNIDVRITPP